ncbi:aldo/keto reductase [Mangrovicoccus sp. HB161399]|uniref:aldo/keto reductase n=1 Tax=Mangrovicoccus sp. HB161399 TaxID=2720392 RepID=UPI00155804E4|nr:aldo/keto reductase [Mangrovicoccus sp. HB161399]
MTETLTRPELRRLGDSDLHIAPMVFGGAVFGWTCDEAMSHRLLDAFTDRGFNCVDTADLYSFWLPGNKGGESETILGNWIAKGNRDKIVLATKCGSPRTPGGGGLSKAHILKTVEDSLKRLKTDRIDLYQAHRDDLVTQPEEILGAYDQLIREGKVRYVGASNFLSPRLKQMLDFAEANGLPKFQTLQPNYNLYDRSEFEWGYEGSLEEICHERGVSVISYFSLASGFLTGKYRTEDDLAKNRARGGDVEKYLNPRGFRILAALDRAAARTGGTPAQVALAWAMAQRTVAAPITSATSMAQLEDLFGAAELVLDAEILADLDKASGNPSVN